MGMMQLGLLCAGLMIVQLVRVCVRRQGSRSTLANGGRDGLLALGFCLGVGFSLLIPIVPFLVFVSVALAIAIQARRAASRAPGQGLEGIAALSGGALAFQAIFYGGHPAGWLVVAIVISIAMCLGARSSPRFQVVFAGLRSPVIAAICGLALVVEIQILLACPADLDRARVVGWLLTLVALRDWLEDVLWLGPAMQALLLAVLVAAAALLSPSLHIVRGYRRVTKAVSLCLLLVTVATSFTFFGGRQFGRWKHPWLVPGRPELRQIAEELDELERTRHEVIKLAVIDVALRSIPQPVHAELRKLAKGLNALSAGEPRALREQREAREMDDVVRRHLEQREREPLDPPSFHPDAPVDRELMWEHTTARFIEHFPIEPFAEEARRALASPGEPASPAALERLRSGGATIGIEDLAVLHVERSRAAAAKAEALAAVFQLVRSLLIPEGGFTDAVVRGLLDRIDLGPTFSTKRLVDLGQAREVLRTAEPPPAVWQFGIGSALGIQAKHEPAAFEQIALEVTAARIARATEREAEVRRRILDAQLRPAFEAEQQREDRARAADRAERERTETRGSRRRGR